MKQLQLGPAWGIISLLPCQHFATNVLLLLKHFTASLFRVPPLLLMHQHTLQLPEAGWWALANLLSSPLDPPWLVG